MSNPKPEPGSRPQTDEDPKGAQPTPNLMPQAFAGGGGWAMESRGGGRGILFLALTLGLLRFVNLGSASLWFDEALTITDAWNPRGVNYNVPGYALNRWLTSLLGGELDEFAVRWPAAIWGYLAVPLTWWAFRPLAGSRRAAGAALLVATSPWALHWSQTGRAYTLVAVVCLLGSGLHFRGLIGGRGLLSIAGMAFVAAGFVIQAQAMVLAGGLWGAGLLLAPSRIRLEPAQKRALRMTLLVGALAGGAVSLWAVDVWLVYLRQKPEIIRLDAMKHFALSAGYQLTPWLAGAGALGGLGALKAKDGAAVHVAWTAFLGAAGVAGAAWFAQTTGQYVFVLLPWVAFLAAWPLGDDAPGLARWTRKAWARRAWMGGLVLASLAMCAFEMGPHRGGRPRWREAWGLVDSQRGPRDLLAAHQAGLGELYIVPGWTDARYPERIGWADRTNPQTMLTLERTTRRVWIVLQPDLLAKWPTRQRKRLERFLEGECTLVERFETPAVGRDLTLAVYMRPARP
jgi:hypothetical protein